MGNRLTKIYTRTGDKGDTGMADGSRVRKDSVLIKTLGDIDELNSVLGLLLNRTDDTSIVDTIRQVQNDLFDLGAELSASIDVLSVDHTDWLEKELDKMNESLPALKEFILPGGGEAAALCHFARSVCRRAERSLVALNQERALRPELLAYINRLSDFLFVLARTLTKLSSGTEVYWQSKRIADSE